MRIYFETSGKNEITDDLIDKIENTLVRLKLQSIKFQIMWSLRSMENEIEKSNGVIVVKSDNLEDQPSISLKNFQGELSIKIKTILEATKFE